MPDLLTSLELIAYLADPTSDQNQSYTHRAYDQSQGAHGPEIAVDIKMIEQRAQRFGARRIEKNRSAEFAEVDRCQNNPAGNEPRAKQRQQYAAESRREPGTTSHRSLGQITMNLNYGARHCTQTIG